MPLLRLVAASLLLCLLREAAILLLGAVPLDPRPSRELPERGAAQVAVVAATLAPLRLFAVVPGAEEVLRGRGRGGDGGWKNGWSGQSQRPGKGGNRV